MKSRSPASLRIRRTTSSDDGSRLRFASGNKYRIVLKGDAKAEYPAVSRVIATLQGLNINKFNLITDLEANPNKTNAVIAK